MGLVVTFIDIGDLVEARKKLEDLASKYSALVQHSNDSIAIVTTNGRILEVNNWLDDSVPPASMVGSYLTDLLEDDRQRVILTTALRNVFERREAISIRLALGQDEPDGIHVEMTFIPAYDPPQGEPLLRDTIMTITRDISEETRHRAEIEETLIDYQAKLDAQSLQGGLANLEGDVIQWNKSRFDDAPSDKIMKSNIRDFLKDDGLKNFEEAFKRVKNGSFEEQVIYKLKDTSLLEFPEGITELAVTYRPLIVDGKIRLIGIQTEER